MDLSDLKKLWREKGFRPNKKLGQNFLIDKNIRDNITKALSLTRESVLIEIGAGFGMMTGVLAEKCAHVIAVEKDVRICGIMKALLESRKNTSLICGDILEMDLCDLAGGEKVVVFGNIPYYISTPIIEKIINQRHCVKAAYIVMQEELADRVVSSPGSKKYGSFSCFAQFYTRPRKLFRISKNSFFPAPEVNSSLVEFTLPEEATVKVKDESLMFAIIRRAFSERRKKIINPLSGDGFLSLDRNGWEALFRAAGIDSSLRAENLSLSDYAVLADAVKTLTSAKSV